MIYRSQKLFNASSSFDRLWMTILLKIKQKPVTLSEPALSADEGKCDIQKELSHQTPSFLSSFDKLWMTIKFKIKQKSVTLSSVEMWYIGRIILSGILRFLPSFDKLWMTIISSKKTNISVTLSPSKCDLRDEKKLSAMFSFRHPSTGSG